MLLTSDAFENNEFIPSKYTCDRENISPPLIISGIPQNTKSLAIICDDPDAPIGVFVHWVIYNIPAETRNIPENLPNEKHIPEGIIQGVNDYGKTGYKGPCPPSGTHRYFFKLYALDAVLNSVSVSTKHQLEDAMSGHIISEAQLIGLYKREN